jgi:hypothetical protein
MTDDKTTQPEAISNLIDALAAKLGDQLQLNPGGNNQIIRQIIHLGLLYRTIKTGADPFLDAR